MKRIAKITFSLMLLSIVGCSTVREAKNAAVLAKNTLVERVTLDSVVVRDSVFIREKADTVYCTRYRTLYKERLRVDTFVCCDTVFLEKEVVVERIVAGSDGGGDGLSWKLPLLLLLGAVALFLLWRTGLLRVLWNLVLKGGRLCIRVFRLKV